MSSALLPSNSTPWERAVADTLDITTSVRDSIVAIRGTKLTSPPPSFLPFLVHEYGLGELAPYVPNLYDLLQQGIRWQRLRGTPAAVAQGLGFIGYSAVIEEALARRQFWNSFQLRFATLPANDHPDLDRIDGIASLSVPARSKLRRGVHRYDVPALEADTTRLDRATGDAESGVRLRPQGPLWSFGRGFEYGHVLTEAEGVALGNWQAPVEAASLTWAEMQFPWEQANFPWEADAAAQRAIVLANWFNGKSGYFVLSDAEGVIGYRRARALVQVRPQPGGPYQFASLSYAPSEAGQFIYASALTDFGDGAGRTVTEIALLVGAAPAPSVPPGRLWLGPDEITGGTWIAASPVSIPLRDTVREEVKLLLRF